jgi:hypothetical protein
MLASTCIHFDLSKSNPSLRYSILLHSTLCNLLYVSTPLPFPIHIQTILAAERLVLSCVCPATLHLAVQWLILSSVSCSATFAFHAVKVLIASQAIALCELSRRGSRAWAP